MPARVFSFLERWHGLYPQRFHVLRLEIKALLSLVCGLASAGGAVAIGSTPIAIVLGSSYCLLAGLLWRRSREERQTARFKVEKNQWQ